MADTEFEKMKEKEKMSPKVRFAIEMLSYGIDGNARKEASKVLIDYLNSLSKNGKKA